MGVRVVIRRAGDGETWAAITSLLRTAYAPLAERGLRFHASYQDEEVTRSRCSEGECYVALLDGALIGTVTALPGGRISELSWYRRPDTASMGQLAVDPRHQGRGIGSALMDVAERRAADWRAARIVIDTSEHAHDLIALYRRRGYEIIDSIRWPETNYRSVVLAKALSVPVASTERD